MYKQINKVYVISGSAVHLDFPVHIDRFFNIVTGRMLFALPVTIRITQPKTMFTVEETVDLELSELVPSHSWLAAEPA